MGPGLQKQNGTGKMNTCAKPRGDTEQIVLGNATFLGKNAKKARYLKAAQQNWEAGAHGSRMSTCGHQKPGSVKCR